MHEAHPTEQAVGIQWYVTDTAGIGGQLRKQPEEFRVEEIERFETEPLDADSGPYPHVVFRATLRRWDTNDFAGVLSDRLGISRERVSWAGTKDKHAVTTQLFSVRDVDPAVLRGAVGNDRTDSDTDAEPAGLDGVTVELLGRAGRAIEFGDLAGNRFEIVVRDGTAPERLPAIVEELSNWADLGTSSGAEDDTSTVAVPNYFGQQRFGSRRPITHEVGLAIVRGDWEDAVRAYVAEAFESEPEDTRAARERAAEAFADRDWTGALDALPERLGYERSMLHALADRDTAEPASFRAALETVPSSLQRLFVNAAQSYAFNCILSARLDRGLPFARPVEGDVVCFADRDGPAELRLPDTDRSQAVTADRVSSVTRHCERGRAFVTAPLVGTETTLAEGEPGEIERAVLDDLDLCPEDFDLPDSWTSTGTRRAILVTTDLGFETDPPTLSFALPKGSYATVLLRECCKVDPIDLG
jgi:tRNA pseudouridine13 synthase